MSPMHNGAVCGGRVGAEKGGGGGHESDLLD